MKIKAFVLVKRKVTLDTNFYEDPAGNLYRVFPEKYNGIVTANVISPDHKTFKKGVQISPGLLSVLEPAEAEDYIYAAVHNAEYEIGKELSAATGEVIAACIEYKTVAVMAKEASQDAKE